MARRRQLAWIGCALLAVVFVAAPGAVGAAPKQGGQTAARRLIEAFVPRLMLREERNPPCGTSGEQYQPTTVETVLGNPAVELGKVEDGHEAVVGRAPTVAQVAQLGADYHLNLPGNPLGDTCAYARDFAKLKREGKAPPVTYAHIARQAGRPGLAVQYWLFWYFNQFNDLHEGDWEGMQIVFRASNPQQALEQGPSEIALFQHAGGEKADWEDPRVEKEGTHPVVYPAAGSHATFYDAAVYLENGRKGSGVGCDDTSAPLRRLSVKPIQVPTRPDPSSSLGWLDFRGHWGQYEKGFNNGPTGPATKGRWIEPLSWMEGIRSNSPPRLPAGSILGPTVTSAFCTAVSEVTSFVNHNQDSPWVLVLVPLAILLLLGFVIWRTNWGPVDLENLRRRRAFGQLLRTTGRLYRAHWRAFAPIGIAAIPVIGGLTALSRLLSGDTGRDLDARIHLSGLHLALGEVVSTVAGPVAFALVAAVVIVVVRQLAEGERPSATGAVRGMIERFGRVVGAQLLATVALILMALTVIGLPFAVWKYVNWVFVQQEILFENRRTRGAFRASSELVRGRWRYTLRVVGVFWLVGVATGPVLGFALIFADLPLTLINLIGALVFALLVPYVAIGTTLLYLDLGATRAEVPARRRRLRPPRRLGIESGA